MSSIINKAVGALLSVVLLAGFFVSSCGSTSEQLYGTWSLGPNDPFLKQSLQLSSDAFEYLTLNSDGTFKIVHFPSYYPGRDGATALVTRGTYERKNDSIRLYYKNMIDPPYRELRVSEKGNTLTTIARGRAAKVFLDGQTYVRWN